MVLPVTPPEPRSIKTLGGRVRGGGGVFARTGPGSPCPWVGVAAVSVQAPEHWRPWGPSGGGHPPPPLRLQGHSKDGGGHPPPPNGCIRTAVHRRRRGVTPPPPPLTPLDPPPSSPSNA